MQDKWKERSQFHEYVNGHCKSPVVAVQLSQYLLDQLGLPPPFFKTVSPMLPYKFYLLA